MHINIILKKPALFACLCLLFSISALGQQYTITGIVKDARNGDALPFATIRVGKTNRGTTTNATGEFALKLPAGKYQILGSYMGYLTDTIAVEIPSDNTKLIFSLEASEVHLPPITVFPGENPAVPIIRQAIKKKKERANRLQTYEYVAYTKVRVKTTEKLLNAREDGISLLYSGPDTSALKIGAIFENQSEGYKKGKLGKEIIVARKQTANLPAYVNTITGGRIMQDFYNETISFMNISLNGPLADNGLAYYYYRILDSIAIDNRPVYKLLVTPDDSLDPGFVGTLYIAADTYDLLKFETGINKAADKMGITDSVAIVQQYNAYGNESIMMPVDFRLDVKANILGMVKVGFDFNTVLSDYKINQPIEDDFFDKAIVTVKTDADKKDSTFWRNIQVLPNSDEELQAYRAFDSTESIDKTFWERNSFLEETWNVGKFYSFSAPLGLYRFNRVESHTVQAAFIARNLMDKRFQYNANVSYGSGDKKWKGDISAEYKGGEYRTWFVRGGIGKRILPLQDEARYTDGLLGSVLIMVLKDEINHYYYADGFNLKAGTELTPILSVNLGFENSTEYSAVKHTDFSIPRLSSVYRENIPINPVRLNTIMFGFGIDFRDYIEDGINRRRVGGNRNSIRFSGEYILSDRKLGSEIDYSISKIRISGRVLGFGNSYLNYTLEGSYGNNSIPLQRLTALQGSSDGIVKEQSFRTLWFNQIFGDRTAELHLLYNFSDELSRATGIGFVKKAAIGVTAFFNAAITNMSSATKRYAAKQSDVLKLPLCEAGFGLSYPKFPINVEFAWRLNYLQENRFKIGVNISVR